jgi:hypothetical protein
VNLAVKIQYLYRGDVIQAAAIAKNGRGVSIPGRTFAWSSDNRAIVDVDSTGRVHAVAKGIASISATTGSVTGTAVIFVSVSCLQAVLIGVPETRTAELEPDCMNDGTYGDYYRFDLDVATHVQIEQMSSAFAPVLSLMYDPGRYSARILAYDEGVRGGKGARIELTLPAGTYYLVASTYNWGDTGSYQLQTRILGSSDVGK